jgi:hypothetical protein
VAWMALMPLVAWMALMPLVALVVLCEYGACQTQPADPHQYQYLCSTSSHGFVHFIMYYLKL